MRHAVICLVLGATIAPQAAAMFPFRRPKWEQPGGLGTPATVTYSYNNFLDGGLKDPDGVPIPADYLRTVTEEAFGLWASVAPLHFVEVPDVGSPVFFDETPEYQAYPDNSFGDIRINHRYIDSPDTPSQPRFKAQAVFPNPSGFPQARISGDVFLDNSDPWAIIGTASEPDVLGILAHELGHSIGVDHINLPGSVMYSPALRRMGPGTGTLTPGDIAAVREIYGAGVGSVTTLVPEPSAIAIALLACCGGVSPYRRRKER